MLSFHIGTLHEDFTYYVCFYIIYIKMINLISRFLQRTFTKQFSGIKILPID